MIPGNDDLKENLQKWFDEQTPPACNKCGGATYITVLEVMTVCKEDDIDDRMTVGMGEIRCKDLECGNVGEMAFKMVPDSKVMDRIKDMKKNYERHQNN